MSPLQIRFGRAPAGRSSVRAIAVVLLLAAILPSPGAEASMHGPISVNGDADLAAQASANGWPGSGTASDPYIIEGLNIDASAQTGIRIAATTKHVVVRGNAIEGSFAPNFGIELAGARNAIVENNTINALSIGLYVHGAQDDIVRGNEVTTATYGAAVVSSSKVTFQDNRILGAGIGLQAILTNAIRIEGNTIDATTRGYYQHQGSGNTLIGNTIQGPVTQGVYLLQTNGNTVRDGTIHNATTAIHIKQGTGNLIENNLIQGGTDGIFLDAVGGNTLAKNRLVNNTDEGILLSSANGNTLRDNDLHGHPKAIHLFFAGQNLVTGGNLTNNTVGVQLFSANSNTLRGMTVSGSTSAGFLVRSSRLNTLTDNLVHENEDGIRLESAADNTLVGTHARDNDRGIVLQLGARQILRGGYFERNTVGLTVAGSNDNQIYDNRFENDENAVVTGNVQNTWSIAPTAGTNVVGGPYTAGNWWHDYIGADADMDGLGELPHSLVPYGQAASQLISSMTGMAYGPMDAHPLMTGPVQQPLV